MTEAKPKKSFWRTLLHVARVAARPILLLVGAKKGTVAEKAPPVLDVLDDVIPK